ncbi:CapA family protein [Caproiciproducens sp. MSJ-32]|uniref:CapA family protein n=1 Tax=Caproiciproducens sp. MSJ-32 TaxID=2841527 RepID=UPI001C10AB8D|nr:CapA family protein [Caproiciproducens sp. MSJ-32]MBU5454688.1 CapA family protein [Caproiciproducens sp. MSJ-32]
MKNTLKLIIILAAIIGIGVFGINKIILNKEGFIEKEREVESNDEEKNEDISNIKEINITAVGDFLIHKEILETQYNPETDSYDFKNTIQYVKKYLEEADLTIANMEGALAGIDNYGYSGYPSFNTPDELADAMKWAGIDVVNNMNNHSLDRDVRGFFRTREFLESKGFDVIGTRGSSSENRYIIKNVEGIKVGIISYSYTMTAEGGVRGLNGIPISTEVYDLMNTFREDSLDLDLQNMKEEIEKMRADGAEVIIFYMHWGDEYALEPNETQIKIAQFLTDEKVDIIFATHPHSIQPIDILKSSDGSSETPVIYSMGNFLSSQRTERIQNPYTEDGVIVSVKIKKDFNSGEIKVNYPTYLPTWVNWYEKNGKLFYEVVPATVSDAEYLTEEGKIRVVESFNRTKGIIESYNDKIVLEEN